MEWLGMPLDASDSVTSFRLLNSARMFGHRGPDSSTRP
jgi:hypothetical protein